VSQGKFYLIGSSSNLKTILFFFIFAVVDMSDLGIGVMGKFPTRDGDFALGQ
jgi:hypothetical protein